MYFSLHTSLYFLPTIPFRFILVSRIALLFSLMFFSLPNLENIVLLILRSKRMKRIILNKSKNYLNLKYRSFLIRTYIKFSHLRSNSWFLHLGMPIYEIEFFIFQFLNFFGNFLTEELFFFYKLILDFEQINPCFFLIIEKQSNKEELNLVVRTFSLKERKRS